MFLPTTRKEIEALGWHQPDVILVSGDSYIDNSFCGVAVIGRVLTDAGFNTAIIAQPATETPEDITRLGEPRLFWGVSGGCVDSMVANYTATKKRRKQDDYTPGGVNNRRPDRAVIQYTNLIRRFHKDTVPIVLGGIEASLRRVAHYDFWSNKLRRSVLFDAKADYLIYGMGERAVVELADSLNNNVKPDWVKGLCYISGNPPEDYIELPTYEKVCKDKKAFVKMFSLFYQNNDPISAKGLHQKHGDRFLVQNPPADPLSMEELDRIYELGFQRRLHPYYQKQGDVRALDTIRFSLTTHRGCYGECNFCAIAIHQGRTVNWRSEASIVREATRLSESTDFRGTITDAGGPTANMYGYECRKKLKSGSCKNRRCLYPEICKELTPDHSKLLNLLGKLRKINGVKHIFTASGIRYDLILNDTATGKKYLDQILKHHISGQMKIAPEHTEDRVLKLMGKPGKKVLTRFKQQFDATNRRSNDKRFLTYYLIAAHPGCSEADMKALKQYCHEVLKTNPEQVQVFTPTPSTWSTLMYYTGTDPFTGQPIFTEKNLQKSEAQKQIITSKKTRQDDRKSKQPFSKKRLRKKK